MANNGIPAVFGVNKYLWNKLQVENIIPSTAPYGGLIPIIPIQEAPQLLQAIDASNPNQTSAPYIVYHWYTNGFDSNSWYRPVDTLVYTTYALDQKLGRQILLLMIDSFKRFDLSARAVNRYIQNPANGLTQDYLDYNYHYISVASATGGTSTTIENDPTTFTVTLRVCYSNPTVDIPLT